MTTPARAPKRPAESPLPAPKLVSLIDGPDSPYADSPAGWWDEYGGAMDRRSGVVYIPPGGTGHACPFPCGECQIRGRQ